MRIPDPHEVLNSNLNLNYSLSNREVSRQEKTRSALIEAYLNLCATEGAGQVTFEKIAQASGFSFGTVRYHFAGDKVDITQSAIVYVLERGRRFMSAQLLMAKDASLGLGSAYDPIQAYLKANMVWMTSYPNHAKFLLYFYYLCTTEQRLLAENQRFLQGSRARILDLIIEGRGRGIYPSDGSTSRLENLATEIHSLALGFCLAAMIEGTESGRKLQLELALQSAQRLLFSAS